MALLSACGSGAAQIPAPGGAARVVPADALAYVNLSLDPARGAVREASSTAHELTGYPALLRAVRSRLAAITGTPYATGIAPWLGGEAAVAFLPARSGASASELIVLGVGNRRAAQRFLAHTQAPVARLLDGYVVIGEPVAVAAAAHAAAVPTASLADLPAHRRAVAAEPPDRVIDADASARGVVELLGGRGGVAGVLAAVVAGHRHVTLAVVPTGDGFRVMLALTGSSPSSSRFDPTLAAALPASTTWMVDTASLTGSAPGLLSTLAAASSSSPAAGLVQRLGRALAAEGVALGPLASVFAGQSAIFGLDGALGLITHPSDVRAARLELGRAGAALVTLLAPGGGAGSEPIVATAPMAGVPVTRWRQGSAQLDAAVVSHDLVLTTSAVAMASVIGAKAALSGSSEYRSVLAGAGSSSGPVLFGAINRLVRRGDQTGLLGSLGLASATASLAQISAAGLASTGRKSQTTAELYLTIS